MPICLPQPMERAILGNLKNQVSQWEKEDWKKMAAYSVIVFCSFFLLVQNIVFADEKLTAIFKTQAFSGSWELFSKFNFIGAITQFVITAFSLLGLSLLVIQKMTTLLYLSQKPLFDTICDLKTSGRGTKIFGFQGMGRELMQGNYGTGADVIVGFLLTLCPNVKWYSEYREDALRNNLEEDDTVTSYILKTALSTIFSVFFFAIGFNGTLWQIYGNFVDGLCVAAEQLADLPLNTFVENALATGANYKFAFDGSGTNEGKFRQNIAKRMYTLVLKNTTNLNTDTKKKIGKAIDEWVGKHITPKNIQNEFKVKVDQKNDNDIKNLDYSITCNTSPGKDYGNGHLAVMAKDLGLSVVGDEIYVHVYIERKSNSKEINYYSAKEGTGKISSDTPTTNKYRE